MIQLARNLLALSRADRRLLQLWLRRGGPTLRSGTAPLDYHQLVLWLVEQRDMDVPPVLIAQGLGSAEIDREALGVALAAAVEPFGELRIGIDSEGDEPLLRTGGGVAPSLEVLDEPTFEARLRDWREPAAEGPPSGLEVFLIRRSRREDLLVLRASPLWGDPWMLGRLGRWLADRCGVESGEGTPVETRGESLGGLATRQRQWLVGAEASRHFLFWKQQLAGIPQDSAFPVDRPGKAARSLRRAKPRRIASRSALERLGAGLDRSEPEEILGPALVLALLFRATGRQDLSVARLEPLPPEPSVGHLGPRRGLRVLGCRLGDDRASFQDLLAAAREASRRAEDHGGIPYELLVDLLADMDAEEAPWGQVVVGSGAPFVSSLGEGSLADLCWSQAFGGSELYLGLDEREDGLWLEPRYSPERFDETTVLRWSRSLSLLAEAAASRVEEPLSDLALLARSERAQLTHQWNDTVGPPGEDRSLMDLFAAQVVRTPDAVAASWSGEQISYRELEGRAEAWSRRLSRRGIGPEELVGLYCRRRLDLLVGVLGILGAGAAYVPLDLRFPAERVEYILRDAGVRVVLSEEGLREKLPPGDFETWALDRPPRLDDDHEAPPPRRPAGRSHLAYLLYTSGSTGKPKAVALEHRGAVALIDWAREAFEPADLERVLLCSSLGFDLSVFEIFLPLATGGCVAVAETPLSLADAAEAPSLQRVTFLNTVPAAMTELVRAWAVPPGVRIICLAGEPLTASLVDKVFATTRARRVLNLYGATEDSTHSTEAWIAPPGDGERPHVGFPIRDTRIYLVDRLGRLAPIGAIGEICLAGDGLARAYHGRPALTAAAFRPNPYSGIPGDRLYFTGDLGRRYADGRLDCLGRRDRQIKLRGFRIELAEIEAVLEAGEGIREAAVLLRRPERGDPALVAYLVTEPTFQPTVTELRRRVAVRLPEYMVPSFFVTLVGFPRTASGKVDRRALPGLADPLAPGSADTAPRTPVEETLAGLWSELLGRSSVPSMQASFFELGGHSVLAARLVAGIRDLYGVTLEVPDIYRAASIEQLATVIEETIVSRRQLRLPPLEAVERGVELGVSPGQRLAWNLEGLPGGSASQNLLAVTHLHGAMDRRVFTGALEPVINRHEALRTRFETAAGETAGAVLCQIVEPVGEGSMARVDLAALPAADRWREVSRLAGLARSLPFDRGQVSLFRVWLLELGAEDNVLVAVLHGSLGDEGSLGILLRDLSRYYFHRLDGCPLPEVMTLQYVDFVHWQKSWAHAEAGAEAKAFWQTSLADAPPLALEAPGVSAPGGARPFSAGSRDFELPAELATALEERGRELQASLFTLFLATFQLLLGGIGSRREVLIGTPAAGRGGRLEAEIMIGCFAHLLPLRTRFEAHLTFPELLAKVQETVRRAHSFREPPYDWLAELQEPGRPSPIQATFSFDIRHPPPPAALRVRPVDVPSGVSNVDLSLAMVQREEGLAGRWTYRREALDREGIEDLSERYVELLRRIGADPHRRLETLDVVR